MRTTLPGTEPVQVLSKFRGAGRYLAFVIELQDFRHMSGTIGVRVYDLRARNALPGGFALDSSASDPMRVRLHALILTTTGVAAWRETGMRDRIAARDLRGRRRVLDSGPPGTLTDLVLTGGTTARWRDAGALTRTRIDTLGR